LLELQVTEEAISVFLSYSRKDKDMLDKLITHLAALRRTGKITTWHDRDIEAGSEWEPELLRQLDTADIILLLISADFMASDYCYGKELQRAIERHDRKEARVIPVILRPCDWNIPEIPFSKLNVLPSDAEPIVSSKWQYYDEALAIVTRGIREVSEQLKNAKLSNKTQITISPFKKTLKESLRPEDQEKQPITSSEFAVNALDTVALASEQGVDYSILRDLLKARKWQEADQETRKVMLKAADRENSDWLGSNGLEKFPCQDLKTINLLWVTASNGHFGFSVQQKIWEDCGSPMSYSKSGWEKFGEILGWRQEGSGEGDFLSYSELQFSLESSPVGELPAGGLQGGVLGCQMLGMRAGCPFSSLVQRLVGCNRAKPSPLVQPISLSLLIPETIYGIDAVALESEKGVDYRQLQDLLKAGKWRQADEETLKVMLKAANRESDGFLGSDSMKKFPYEDLKVINLLWVIASNGHFGFSIQKKIWEKCGSPMFYNHEYKIFCRLLGWYDGDEDIVVHKYWSNFEQLRFDLDCSPLGELPSKFCEIPSRRGSHWGCVGHLFSRAFTCGT
jgi:GUN4-like/TIR domain